MAAMLDALDHAFMQRALLASVLLGMLAGALSPLIVQRRMAFLGSGLAHAAFAGVALGLWLPVDPFWIAAPYTVLVALVIQWLRDRTPLEADTIIGVIFAASMALGIVLLALRRDAMMTDAWSLLFGSILAIRPGDIAVLAVLLIAAVLGRRWWARWAYATFDEDLARVDRPVAHRDDYLLVAVLAVVLVAAIKIAGIVLASAFLVLPGAAARLNARTFFGMTVVAVVIGAVTAVAGLLLAYAIDTPSGPTLVLAQTAVIAGAFAVARARQ
jgi:zinc transport system permease protein